MEIFSPNFTFACEKANEILVCSNIISTFPYSMSKVMDEFAEAVQMPFSSLSGGGLTPAQIVGSKDGGLFCNGSGEYVFLYNETMPQTRLRFTGGHELGHYMIGHDMRAATLYRETKDKRLEPQYKMFEAEANMFASQILMPEQIIIELSKRGCKITTGFLERVFNVSGQAAEIRMKNLHKVYDWDSFRRYRASQTLSYDDIILEKFKSFIDKNAPRKHSLEYDLEKELEMEKERQSWY